jgi:hypothetical protein
MNATSKQKMLWSFVVLLIVTLLTGVLTITSFLDALALNLMGYRTSGTVVDVTDTTRKTDEVEYIVMVAITNAAGQKTQVNLTDRQPTVEYPIGTQLDLIYRPSVPRKPHILKINNFWGIWGSTVLAGSGLIISFTLFCLFMKSAMRQATYARGSSYPGSHKSKTPNNSAKRIKKL